MFRKFDHLYRKFYFKFCMGLPLLFITVSPYSDSNKKAKEKDTGKSPPAVRQFNSPMMHQLLDGADTEGQDPMLPYEVFLTQAPAEKHFYSRDNKKMFLPIPENFMESRGDGGNTQMLYERLLNSYLNRVEELILVKKDYASALKELDKMMILAPLNPRVRSLKKELNKRIEDELKRVQNGRIRTSVPPKSRGVETSPELPPQKSPTKLLEVLEQKEKTKEGEPLNRDQIKKVALMEAEKQLLEESRKFSEELKERLTETMRVTQTQDLKEMETSQGKEKELLGGEDEYPVTLRTLEEVQEILPPPPPEKKGLAQNDKAAKAEVEKAEFIDFVKDPFDYQYSVPQEEAVPEVGQITPEVPPVEFEVQKEGKPNPLETTPTDENVSIDFEDIVPERVKEYILRGKKYFRQKNYSLALVSFSKAKQYDTNGTYKNELKSLIRLTKDRLEKLTAF